MRKRMRIKMVKRVKRVKRRKGIIKKGKRGRAITM